MNFRFLKVLIRNRLSVFVIVGLISIFGIRSYYSLPRETFPEVQVPYIFVNTFYLGVSPKDIEILVTNPLEAKLKNIKGLKNIRSVSKESYSSLFLEFNPDVNVDIALQRVKDKVDQASPDLPEDAEVPLVNEFSFDDFPFIYVNLFGQYDLVRLTQIAEDLKDELDKIPGILEVAVVGGQEREIQIIVSPTLLKEKGLSFNDISRVIQGENINIPGGTLEIGKSRYSVRIPGEFEDVSELNHLIIKYDKGNPIYLMDVAEIKDTFKDQNSYSRFNCQPSLTLSLKKRSGSNVLESSEAVKKVTEKFINSHQYKGLEVYFLGDVSKYIRNMILDLENSILTGFVLVFFVLFLFLGVKNAILAALAIPFSMMLSFIVLKALGFSANMMVLYSLVLALGMLVDNAIVIIENIYRFFQKGLSIKKAAYQGAKQVAIPVIASTLTTLAAFFPLIFWPGFMGKFMGYLPKTLIITLTASLCIGLLVSPVIIANFYSFGMFVVIAAALGLPFGIVKILGLTTGVAFLILPFSIAVGLWLFPKLNQAEKTSEKRMKAKMKRKSARPASPWILAYERLLRFSLKHSLMVPILVLGLLIGSIVAYASWGQPAIFFPETTPTEGYINIKLPAGSILSETDKITCKIGALLGKYRDLKNFNANIGSQSGGFESGQTNTNQAQFILEFYDRSVDDVPEGFDPVNTLSLIRKELKSIPGAEIKVERDKGGPPTGAPVSLKVRGDNFDILLQISTEIQNYIKDVDGLVNLKDDYEEGLPEIMIRLNRRKMAVLGVNTAMVASAIRTAIYGSKVSVYRDSVTEEEYDITLRYPVESRRNIEDLNNIHVTSMQGNQIPLSVFSTMEFTKGIGYVIHQDFERVIEVSAELDKGFNGRQVRKAVMSILDDKLVLPQGYFLDSGGEAEEEQESATFLSTAFTLAIFLIFLVLITQFHSLLTPFIILLTIVLSMIGLLWGLIITATPFSTVMTGVGVISLAGIVVNNGIVLLDYIIRLRKEGRSKFDAIVEAGKTRFRPVMLTAATTVLGLIPMSTGFNFDFHEMRFAYNPEATEWWASMSNGVIFGLAVATLLTLIVVPTLYFLFENWKEWVFEKLFQKKPDIL